MRDGEGGGIAECVGECQPHVLSLFANKNEWSRDKEQCRQAYIRLVYDLIWQVMRDMHAVKPVKSVWMQFTAVRPHLFRKGKLEPFTGGCAEESVGKTCKQTAPLSPSLFQIPTRYISKD